MRPEDTDIISLIKSLVKRVTSLEVGRLISNLKFPATGTLVVPTGANDPASGEEGSLFFNTTAHKLKVYASGAWVAVH